MKYWLMVVFAALTAIKVFGITKSQVRVLYQKAAKSESACEELLSNLKAYNEDNNPVFGGYKACATMMMANYVINPLSKLNHFSTGKLLLEKCIKTNKENLELRFLRFAVQTKSPAFLGYNISINEDKAMLLAALKGNLEPELKQIVLAFLKDSEYLSLAEKQGLR
jgi:hypothetical protein